MKNYLSLQYNKPAEQWEEALPLGNGRIGAMVYGGTKIETIQLNEDTFWSGILRKTSDSSAKRHLDEVRELIFDRQYRRAQDIIESEMLGPWTESYLPVGELKIAINELDGEINGYIRKLDIKNALHTTNFSCGGCEYSYETFISAPDNVVVVRLKSNEPINVSFWLESVVRHTVFEKDGLYTMECIAPSHVEPEYVRDCPEPIIYDESQKTIKCVTQIKSTCDNGSVQFKINRLVAEGVTKLELRVAVRTSFSGFNKQPCNDAMSLCSQDLLKLKSKDYNEIKTVHISDYKKLFDRVELDLGENEAADLCTDERLRGISEGIYDPQIYAL